MKRGNASPASCFPVDCLMAAVSHLIIKPTQAHHQAWGRSGPNRKSEFRDRCVVAFRTTGTGGGIVAGSRSNPTGFLRNFRGIQARFPVSTPLERIFAAVRTSASLRKFGTPDPAEGNR